jgi:ribonuclease D
VTPPDFVVADTPAAVERLAARLRSEPRVALDTEADSLHAFRERVCVVQASVPGLDAVVDPLAVADLAPIAHALARDDVEVVLHGGDYDVSILTRDHAFEFRRVFDTMVAATLLGDERVGLSALVEGAFGVRLSKRFQKADWRRRPFGGEEIEYLRGDTRHLLALRDLLAGRLAANDLVEEADIEFRRLAARRGTARASDPEAWRAAKGADRLDERGRAVAAALWAWRDRRAEAADVPRFRVFPNETLVALAADPAESVDALRARGEFRAVLEEGDGPSLIETVGRALRDAARGAAPAPPARPRRTPEERALLDAVRERTERLKAWRSKEAARRGVPNVVVLPNPAVEAIAASPPGDVAAVAAVPDVGPKRAALYGTRILELLAG